MNELIKKKVTKCRIHTNTYITSFTARVADNRALSYATWDLNIDTIYLSV